jgi:hypothetical protein
MPGITEKIRFFIKKKFWIFLEKTYFFEISKYLNFDHFVIQNQIKYRKNKSLFSFVLWLWKSAFFVKNFWWHLSKWSYNYGECTKNTHFDDYRRIRKNFIIPAPYSRLVLKLSNFHKKKKFCFTSPNEVKVKKAKNRLFSKLQIIIFYVLKFQKFTTVAHLATDVWKSLNGVGYCLNSSIHVWL